MIVGKCNVSIDNGKNKTQNVSYVEGLKHNLQSVSQMCDKGYNLTFHSKGSEINKASLRRLVTNVNRTLRNVYIFYLWHRRCWPLTKFWDFDRLVEGGVQGEAEIVGSHPPFRDFWI
jgi:hypothetical protein